MHKQKNYFIIFSNKFPEKSQRLRKYGAPARFITEFLLGGGGGGSWSTPGTDRVNAILEMF